MANNIHIIVKQTNKSVRLKFKSQDTLLIFIYISIYLSSIYTHTHKQNKISAKSTKNFFDKHLK